MVATLEYMELLLEKMGQNIRKIAFLKNPEVLEGNSGGVNPTDSYGSNISQLSRYISKVILTL